MMVLSLAFHDPLESCDPLVPDGREGLFWTFCDILGISEKISSSELAVNFAISRFR
jgi:hypothetical protein